MRRVIVKMISIKIELKEFEVKNKLGIKDKDFIKLAKVIEELYNVMIDDYLKTKRFQSLLESYTYPEDLEVFKNQIVKDYIFLYIGHFSKKTQKFIQKYKREFLIDNCGWIELLSDLIVIERGYNGDS